MGMCRPDRGRRLRRGQVRGKMGLRPLRCFMKQSGACILAVTLLGAAAANLVTGTGEVRPADEATNSVGMKLTRLEAGEFLMGEGKAGPRTREEWLQRDADE